MTPNWSTPHFRIWGFAFREKSDLSPNCARFYLILDISRPAIAAGIVKIYDFLPDQERIATGLGGCRRRATGFPTR